jgi:hypothetical protein
MWRLFDPLHAVTYFAPESTEEFRACGLKGFWMGYFAGRAAPMGAVEPAVVTATFFNFAPKMASRALPDAWALASPATVLDARLSGVDRAFERVFGSERPPPEFARAAAIAGAAAEATTVVGRPLAAANAALPWPTDPRLALWHATTILREHRGDGHVAALVAAGLDGCQAHVSFVATGAISRSVLQPSRGWTDEEWEAAERALIERGWLDEADTGVLTPTGAAARREIEEAHRRLGRRALAADRRRGHRGAPGPAPAHGPPDRRSRPGAVSQPHRPRPGVVSQRRRGDEYLRHRADGARRALRIG